jgi:NADP-dependent 3-hydroxy acid dehydrogenase YdfG
MKTALITGASTGIGVVFALQLAQRQMELILVARSRDKLELDFPRINILAMAKSLIEPELKPYNTNGLLDTNS